MPTYQYACTNTSCGNRFELLQKAVTSVRATLYGRWAEIIVVDGGSTDGSREWLEKGADLSLFGNRAEEDQLEMADFPLK
jgi:glycosyltransferase involved in cell wall biosynthesis